MARVALFGALLFCVASAVLGAPDPARASQEGGAKVPETMPASPSAQSAEPRPAPPGDARVLDPRPLIRLKVKNAFRPEDVVLPQVVEGRLISDLADMETFRMTGQSDLPDYRLFATIRNLSLGTGVSYGPSHDADATTHPQQKDMVTVALDLDLSLLDRQDREIYAGKLSVSASRELEISMERTNEMLTQELIDRAAQKLERTLRKKLPKGKP